MLDAIALSKIEDGRERPEKSVRWELAEIPQPQNPCTERLAVGNDQRSQYDGNYLTPITHYKLMKVGNDQRSQYDGNVRPMESGSMVRGVGNDQRSRYDGNRC